ARRNLVRAVTGRRVVRRGLASRMAAGRVVVGRVVVGRGGPIPHVLAGLIGPVTADGVAGHGLVVGVGAVARRRAFVGVVVTQGGLIRRVASGRIARRCFVL